METYPGATTNSLPAGLGQMDTGYEQFKNICSGIATAVHCGYFKLCLWKFPQLLTYLHILQQLRENW